MKNNVMKKYLRIAQENVIDEGILVSKAEYGRAARIGHPV